MPKPKQKHSFCNVCKQVYDDYQKHIISQKHKQQIKNNPFNDHLIQLCFKFSTNFNKYEEDTNQNDSDRNLFKRMFNENSQTFGIENYHNLNNEIQIPQFLFPTRSTKQSFQVLNPNICKGTKSFHNFAEHNQSMRFNQQQENNFQPYFFQQSIFKQMNQNFQIQNLGCLKVVDQTASPIKSKFSKPIILTNTSFKLVE